MSGFAPDSLHGATDAVHGDWKPRGFGIILLGGGLP
jgi:hypothetical protein